MVEDKKIILTILKLANMSKLGRANDFINYLIIPTPSKKEKKKKLQQNTFESLKKIEDKFN